MDFIDSGEGGEIGARVEVGFSQDRQFLDRSLAGEEGDGGDSDGGGRRKSKGGGWDSDVGRMKENWRAEGGIVVKAISLWAAGMLCMLCVLCFL